MKTDTESNMFRINLVFPASNPLLLGYPQLRENHHHLPSGTDRKPDSVLPPHTPRPAHYHAQSAGLLFLAIQQHADPPRPLPFPTQHFLSEAPACNHHLPNRRN